MLPRAKLQIFVAFLKLCMCQSKLMQDLQFKIIRWLTLLDTVSMSNTLGWVVTTDHLVLPSNNFFSTILIFDACMKLKQSMQSLYIVSFWHYQFEVFVRSLLKMFWAVPVTTCLTLIDRSLSFKFSNMWKIGMCARSRVHDMSTAAAADLTNVQMKMSVMHEHQLIGIFSGNQQVWTWIAHMWSCCFTYQAIIVFK